MGYDIVLDALNIDFMRTDLSEIAPELDLLIRQHGQEVFLVPRIVCPCADTTREGGTGTSNPACKACQGTGLAYMFSEAKAPKIAIVTGTETRKTFTPATPIIGGSIRVVFQSNEKPAEGDLIRVPAFVQVGDYLWKHSSCDGYAQLPFDVVSAEYLALRTDPHNIELLEHGKDYTIDYERSRVVIPRTSKIREGNSVSGRFTCIPYYIISSIPAAARGQISTVFSDHGEQEFITFPKSVVAERTDALFGRFL